MFCSKLRRGISLKYIFYCKTNVYNSQSFRRCSVLFNRENFQTFDSMVALRRNEAKKSAILHFPADLECESVYNFCTKFGSIIKTYKFNLDINKNIRGLLIEFQEESSLKELLANNLSSKPGLWISLPYIAVTKKMVSNSTNLCNSSLNCDNLIQLYPPLYNQIIEQKLSENGLTVSQQMECLYNNYKMTDLGWRLRFLICRKIEYLLPLYMGHAAVLPFGSSVNTYGNYNCDLDMTVDTVLNKDKILPAERTIIQKQLEAIGYSMIAYNLGFKKIMKIFNARVPIIKCTDTITGLECDITTDNKSGYHMSQILYMYGCCDARVRPFIYTLRWWARNVKVSQIISPSPNVTNFSLTLLGLFYLMNTTPRVIPPLQSLKNDAKKFAENGVQYFCTEHVSTMPVSQNEESLEDLLNGFFEMYSKVPLKKSIISLNSGKIMGRVESGALYIENPIENSLNVSRNVSYEAVENFQEECKRACFLISAGAPQDSRLGILSLLNKKSSLDAKSVFNKEKMTLKLNFTNKNHMSKNNNKNKHKKRNLKVKYFI